MPVAADAGIRLGVSPQHSGNRTDTMVFAPPVEWVLAGARFQVEFFFALALNKFQSKLCKQGPNFPHFLKWPSSC